MQKKNPVQLDLFIWQYRGKQSPYLISDFLSVPLSTFTWEYSASARKVRREYKRRFSTSGCYVFFQNSECLYVGQSYNVRERLAQHLRLRGRKSFCCPTILTEYDVSDITVDILITIQHKELEYFLVSQLHPIKNKVLPSGASR